MKIVILAGGAGTRLAEETTLRPKPMVEIGGKPMLLHIMRVSTRLKATRTSDRLRVQGRGHQGINPKFPSPQQRDLRELERMPSTGCELLSTSRLASWPRIDTGLNTLTGGRLRRMKDLIGRAPFMVSYGDGVGNVDVRALLNFHRSHGNPATVTAVSPVARFGSLQMNGDQVIRFTEKPVSGEGWINGGFFVFQPEVLDYISGDNVPLEGEPLERLASEGQLLAYRHSGFWHPMDTLRDKQLLESLWAAGNPPWVTP